MNSPVAWIFLGYLLGVLVMVLMEAIVNGVAEIVEWWKEKKS